MRIRGTCNPCKPKLEFDDLRVGDVLTFPTSPGWKQHVMIVAWSLDIYGKKYGEIDAHTLIRLDGKTKEHNNVITSDYRADNATAGQSYTLTRDMMEKRGCYEPLRWEASVCLEENTQ